MHAQIILRSEITHARANQREEKPVGRKELQLSAEVEYTDLIRAGECVSSGLRV